MIDLKLLLEKPDFFKKALSKKNYSGDLSIVMELDTKRRQLLHKKENLRAEQNKLSEQIPKTSNEEKNSLLEQSKELKEAMKNLDPELETIEKQLNELALTIPNPPLDDVPEGKDDTENVVIKTVNEKPIFDFEPKDHIELGRICNLIEMEAAANMSGTRFYYLKNEAALLEFALVQFVLNKLVKRGFTPIIPPVLVKEQAMVATGFFPADRNEIYQVNPGEDNLFLVGTSEVPLCMLHADQILNEEKLPLRYAAFSTCFRREAGSYGKDTHGILRVHQFDKIEMFSFSPPSKSKEEHQLILSMEEEIMKELGFHYQVLNICGGDLGAPAAQKYDIEVWIPSQNRFRELTSCSNCTDFQARRANIRCKQTSPAEGAKSGNPFAHTLNGTAVAIGRTLIAIMENYQQKDGSIIIPTVLQPYMGNKERIEPKEK